MRVLTMGTFDIIHYGHFKILKMCRELAGDGEVVVGLNTDGFILRYRHKLPVMRYEEREKNLVLLPWVDRIVPNGQPRGSAKNIIKAVGPDLCVISSDWSPWGPGKKDYLKQLGITQAFLDENYISLVFVPHTWGISSTQIKFNARS